MEISTDSVNSVTVVRLKGNLDTGTSPEAQNTLMGLVSDESSKIVINLSGVDYVSSAGLRVFLMLAKRLKVSNGSLRLCGLNEMIQEVFDFSGFSTLLKLSPSEEEAVGDIGSSTI